MSSHATQMQNAILRIASKSDEGLDLTKIPSQASIGIKLPEDTISSGEKVVIIGATDPVGTICSVVQSVENEGTVLVIDSDLTSLNESKKEIDQTVNKNVQFLQAELDDFQTNSIVISEFLSDHPIQNISSYRSLQSVIEEQRTNNPLVADESVDVIIIDTCINGLPVFRIRKTLSEAFRVLRRGGRIVIKSILADEQVPDPFPYTSESKNLTYVPLEKEIMDFLEDTGFYGMKFIQRANFPIKVVKGVEFRSFIVDGYKGKQGICLDQGHAVIYRGPWSEVLDDDGHRYVRGDRVAVCSKTFNIVKQEPYKNEFMYIPPYVEIPKDQAPLFDCDTPQLREPSVTKGRKSVFEVKSTNDDSCMTPGDCC